MNAAPPTSTTTSSVALSPIARPDGPQRAERDESEAEMLVEELLVEEVSIDGMCGVY
ncbi:MAG TPA: mycofactocin precursor MftA [Acidimicrobiales bacterium]|nr:mycofactocin precursor MftA [Acidimicrobiales bacterium]